MIQFQNLCESVPCRILLADLPLQRAKFISELTLEGANDSASFRSLLAASRSPKQTRRLPAT